MGSSPRPARVDDQSAFAEVFGVSRETADRLVVYADLLRRWQRATNLVAPSTLDSIWHRHFADSAQLLRLIPPEARTLADLGTGAGFPGMVLAICQGEAPALRISLVESDRRKAAFLREVARQTGAAVEILCGRIESGETQARLGRLDVVTARALAPLVRLLRLAFPILEPGGTGLFPKGRQAEAEVQDASAAWAFASELVPSLTENEGRIVVVRNLTAKVKATP